MQKIEKEQQKRIKSLLNTITFWNVTLFIKKKKEKIVKLYEVEADHSSLEKSSSKSTREVVME